MVDSSSIDIKPYLKTTDQEARDQYNKSVTDERLRDEPGLELLSSSYVYSIAKADTPQAMARRAARGGMAEQAVEWEEQRAQANYSSFGKLGSLVVSGLLADHVAWTRDESLELGQSKEYIAHTPDRFEENILPRLMPRSGLTPQISPPSKQVLENPERPIDRIVPTALN